MQMCVLEAGMESKDKWLHLTDSICRMYYLSLS